MEVTLSLYTLAFWATIAFTIVGGFLGLLGVWISEFWRSEACIKLLFTNAILAGTSLLVAVITKWLG
jgi:hypothetical protein